MKNSIQYSTKESSKVFPRWRRGQGAEKAYTEWRELSSQSSQDWTRIL